MDTLPTTLAQSPLCHLQYDEYELKRIPKEQLVVCISNALPNGLALKAQQSLWRELGQAFKWIDPETHNKLPGPKKHLQDSLFEAERDQLFLGTTFRSLSLDDGVPRLGHANLTRILFKLIKKKKILVLPLHFSVVEYDVQQIPVIRVRIGHPLKEKHQARFDRPRQLRKFVRAKIFALGYAMELQQFFPEKVEDQEAIIEPIDPHLLERDIEQLPAKSLMVRKAEFDVYIAKAQQIPNLLTEIGRLREITFREEGEGTGRKLDLDEYDLDYEQLFIWDREAKRLVGGYRIGRGDEIFGKYGVEGFYIYSLFRIKKGFFPIMRESVELGRSYIIPDYQRKRLPLFLLWKGILAFLLRHPQYRFLYGPVSISKYYSHLAKGLIIQFVKAYYFDEKLARFLKPRTPFKFKKEKLDLQSLMRNFDGKLANLDQFIEDIEPGHIRIPILMKKYIKQNARFISFNLDPNFSDALDGFMILDLKDVPEETLEALQKEI
ncbi:MAG: GNAT family N-acyltransferase [Bacteroidota bacterium]